MEITKIDNDINVFCVSAKSFPEGILEAHQKLHSLIPFSTERKYFGISYPSQEGDILYKAAATELNKGELSKHHLEGFTIKKGDYLLITIHNYTQDIPAIGKAFQEMLADNRIDPKGFCLEWYVNNVDCKCMVRMK